MYCEERVAFVPLGRFLQAGKIDNTCLGDVFGCENVTVDSPLNGTVGDFFRARKKSKVSTVEREVKP